MPIEFRCSSCNRLLRTGDGTAGQQAKCPECQAIQTIPTPEMLSPEAPAAGQAPFEPPQPGFPPPYQAGTDPFGAPGQAPAGGFPPMGPAVVPAELRAHALRRVSAPGMLLIVFGVLGIILGVLAIALELSGLAGGMPPFPDPKMADLFKGFEAGFKVGNVAGTVLGIGVAILMIVGGIQMRKLQSRELCIAAAILAIIPCFSPCCCLEIPFGIWALVVLLDGQVSAAFS